jgi:enoyl-CoA hydratase/carnithine racemase
MASKLLVETGDRVASITVNRPDRRDALDRDTMPGLDQVLRGERLHQQDIFRTEDFTEGVRAFLEKRLTPYRGR